MGRSLRISGDDHPACAQECCVLVAVPVAVCQATKLKGAFRYSGESGFAETNGQRVMDVEWCVPNSFSCYIYFWSTAGVSDFPVIKQESNKRDVSRALVLGYKYVAVNVSVHNQERGNPAWQTANASPRRTGKRGRVQEKWIITDV